jgi:D-3-phosphoglycerate dehydrogenase / 2-oxoglutarate reductase
MTLATDLQPVAMKVAVTAHNFGDLAIERDVFETRDIEMDELDTDDPAQICRSAADADGLLVQYAPVTESLFQSLDSLRVVGRYGIGVDNIDLDSATDHDVAVVNAPHYCTDEVAEHALALLLACERKVALFDAAIDAGDWDWKQGRPIRRLRGKTLGLVGFGSIARTVAEKARGFGFETIAYDPYLSSDDIASHGVEKVDFNAVLERSDIVSIHSPLTDDTRGLVDDDAFGRMDTEATLINVARGEIVDTGALARALSSGEIRAAGLDVLPDEPPESSALIGRDDVVLTPHAAWYSEDSIVELRRTVATAVADALHGDSPETVVNTDVIS